MEKLVSKKKITELEFRIIEKVKEVRTKKGVSRMQLSNDIRVDKGFVGKVESYAHPDKYNFSHLFRIAKILKIKSIRDLIPNDMPKYEDIEIVYEMVPKINKDGSQSKQLESSVLEIRPKTER
ncbi:XRE family transcriptional regulator [Sphingobacterium sp. UT-1RO-CII-1]|uniref:XRE family transcriptional regulator n=1 Tax=Sphingobacterium sp. UT-1RO-CII-1 TaxID=2995225 RepID=UPI00227AB751|nr:XRE family transcriptional regulator [Sphingobacterium sp. UT-1RO-CII-1]MCY4778908.1 XRE family transcriptional regulator [Sphingobacterium sp. UT-1RO-CII-1]